MHRKTPSFAMIYAVIVLIFITIICSAFIMLMYYNKLYLDISIRKEKLNENAISGINLFLCENSTVGVDESKTLTLFDNEDDQVTISRKKWGIFDIIISTAEWRKHSCSKIAFTGDMLAAEDKTALYLVDREKKLGLCGNTTIKGDCYLPKVGMERTYIEGKNFAGKDMVTGSIKKSDRKIPEFNCIKELFSQVKKRNISTDSDTLITYDEYLPDTIINAFTNKTMVLYSANDIDMKNKFFKGNIKIISDKSVKIDPSNRIQDVIIISPYVSMKENFTGSLQAFATDSLIVGKDCELKYPSVLGVFVTKTDTIQPYLEIREKATVRGIVFVYAEKSPTVLRPYVKVDEDAVIEGQLISTNDLQLRGTVNGSVFTTRFILKTASSYYENNLLDATIDFTALPKEYIGISSSKEGNKKKIIKWLF